MSGNSGGVAETRVLLLFSLCDSEIINYCFVCCPHHFCNRETNVALTTSLPESDPHLRQSGGTHMLFIVIIRRICRKDFEIVYVLSRKRTFHDNGINFNYAIMSQIVDAWRVNIKTEKLLSRVVFMRITCNVCYLKIQCRDLNYYCLREFVSLLSFDLRTRHINIVKMQKQIVSNVKLTLRLPKSRTCCPVDNGSERWSCVRADDNVGVIAHRATADSRFRQVGRNSTLIAAAIPPDPRCAPVRRRSDGRCQTKKNTEERNICNKIRLFADICFFFPLVI